MEEQAEIGVVLEENGNVGFVSTSDGALIQQVQLPIPKGVKIVSFSAARPTSSVVELGLGNGQALVAGIGTRIVIRTISASLLRSLTIRLALPWSISRLNNNQG